MGGLQAFGETLKIILQMSQVSFLWKGWVEGFSFQQFIKGIHSPEKHQEHLRGVYKA